MLGPIICYPKLFLLMTTHEEKVMRNCQEGWEKQMMAISLYNSK